MKAVLAISHRMTSHGKILFSLKKKMEANNTVKHENSKKIGMKLFRPKCQKITAEVTKTGRSVA